MNETQIFDGVQEVLRKHLQIESPVGLETDLFRDLELDSLKQLTFVVELENHFKVCFDEGDEEGLHTIGDVVALITRRVTRDPGDRDTTPMTEQTLQTLFERARTPRLGVHSSTDQNERRFFPMKTSSNGRSGLQVG